MLSYKTIILIICSILPVATVFGQDRFSIHTDFAEVNTDNKLVQDIFCIGDSAFDGFVTISCYHYSSNDSLLLYKKTNEPVEIKKGNQKFRVVFNVGRSTRNPKFFNLLKNTNTLPAGEYKTYISLFDSTQVLVDKMFIRSVDSTLDGMSPLKKTLDDILAPKKKGIVSLDTKAPAVMSKAAADKKLKRSQKRIVRELKNKSVHAYFLTIANKEVIDLYHDKIFIGRYLAGAAMHQKNSIGMPDEFSRMADNDLGNYESLFSQSKKVRKNKNNEKEVKGELGLSVNVSNDQEENSGQGNNYYELYGSIATEVMKLPVVIDGFYTSQDQNRNIKSSFIKVKYDIDRIKSDQKKQINGYKNNYEQTKAKSGMMQSTCQSFIKMLESRKSSLINELKADNGFIGVSLDTVALRNKLEEEVKGTDSSSDRNERKKKAEEKYSRAIEKYRKLEETEKKLAKYRTLSDQYKNTLLFDSVFAYEKIKKLQGDDVSYKRMVRESENMLPDGKAKKFISGLTGFEAGMITKDVSKNTLNGQMVKGANAGYDLGFCETEFTVGNAEYIGRDGSIDKYTCYSGSINFKPAQEQKTSLIYYGYNPSRRMLRQDTFFKDVDLSLPGFREPVHIVSVKHSGDILHRVHVETEVATSFRRNESTEVNKAPLNDKLSYNINLEGEIPRTTINLTGSYDHCGKDFENNSLPVNYSGTDKYMLGSRGTFFKSILTLGVEYNYLVQHNMASKGGNSRWGFDVAAKSKRYPSVYLSYKPFTTFRSFDDTLNIAQRAMVGDVWNGRISYQIRRKHHATQFMMLYNRSHSEMDTLNYTNSMLQFNCGFTNDRMNLVLALGSSANKGSNIAAVHNATRFMNLSAGYQLNSVLNVFGGTDIGVAAFGLSKYGANAGAAYRHEKLKLTIRPRVRYGAYKIGEGYQWKNIYNACIDVIWEFNMKINKT